MFFLFYSLPSLENPQRDSSGKWQRLVAPEPNKRKWGKMGKIAESTRLATTVRRRRPLRTQLGHSLSVRVSWRQQEKNNKKKKKQTRNGAKAASQQASKKQKETKTIAVQKEVLEVRSRRKERGKKLTKRKL